jgi:type I restriction enzyme S subunit
MPEKLPKGWVKTTLGEIAEPSRERALPMEFPGLRYVGLEHIEAHSMKLLVHEDAREARSSSVRFSKGDVLYGKMRPYLNKVWVAEFDGLCSAEFLVFPKSEGLNSQFLAFRLNAEDFVTFANGQVSGERPRVDFDRLSRFPVVLPPIAEQEKIVIKLSAALSRVERAEKAARRAQKRLKDYRVGVLNAAVTGKLTRAWRAAPRKNEKETGKALLQRLLAARRARWEDAELRRLRTAGKAPKDDTWKSRYREPIPPDMKDLAALPKGWMWASIDQLSWDSGYGTSVKCTYEAKGPAVLRIPNIRNRTLDFRDLKFAASSSDFANNQFVATGDLLLIRTNGSKDLIGRAAVVTTPPKVKCSFASYLIRFRLVGKEELWSWLGFTWDSRFIRVHIEAKAKTTAGQYNVSLSGLSGTTIPLPPLAEQSESVREVKRRLSAADRLEATLERQLVRAHATRQSLLRDAFTGSLVPQNAQDQPASLLLERIRAEKVRKQAEPREGRQGRRYKKGIKSVAMQQTSPSPETLRAAWRKIGKTISARRVFDEAGFAPEQVVQFYEALRATPEMREAFKKASQGGGRREKPIEHIHQAQEQPGGRFRLVELWLEDFKNLKDYTVRFNPAQGLDVVLGWNGTGKSNLFEALVTIFRDLHEWSEKNRWSDMPMNGFRISYEIDEHTVEVSWQPSQMKRPELSRGPNVRGAEGPRKLESIKREDLPLPRFVFGYYSGPTNRLAELFRSMKQDHYDRLRLAKTDDAETLAKLLEQRRFFCAEAHHAKYVLLAFFYK